MPAKPTRLATPIAAAFLLLLCSPLLCWPAAAQTLLVANKSDDTVDLVDAASGEVRATVDTGKAPHEIAVAPDGRLAAVANYGDREAPGNTLTIVDVGKATAVRTIDLGGNTRPHGLAWLAADRLAITTEGSGRLLLVDPLAGEIVSEAATGQEISHMVAALPDGSRAFVANIGSGTVTAVDLEAGTRIGEIATGDGAEGITVTPDGSEVWVTNRGADTLSVIDPATLEIVATIPCPGFPIRVEITPDGTRALVSAARSGEVAIFDVAGRKELLRRTLDLANAPDADRRLFGDRFGDSPVPVGIEIAPDGETAWIAATQSDAVVEVSTRDLSVVGLVKAGREPDGMAYSAQEVAGGVRR